MNIPKEFDAIALRITEIENQLRIIEAALEKQKSEPYLSRRREVCNFLVIEREVFTARLNELKWVLHD
ncbi:hypothetical protein A4H97_22275 [Niastella yeongjuensis]|uniref:Uncharacterized protein n=1 Tax=Niastella yeongjuensis TaxID=354355 RepID=A0A1V9F7L6_9BACT|nr:hypothetical protein [Niastella yeongjuensis]OQP54227.1 hypothetical protein A4H97_22275 [Niastella yeongjuensis]SEP31662.1 hypothetical protein SAMN05660816_05256 [Niastella yeongjuensis]